MIKKFAKQLFKGKLRIQVLTVNILLTLVPLLLMSSVMVYLYQTSMRTTVKNNAEELFLQVDQRILERLQEVERVSQSVFHNHDIQTITVNPQAVNFYDNHKLIGTFLDSIAETSPYIRSITIYDMYDRIYRSAVHVNFDFKSPVYDDVRESDAFKKGALIFVNYDTDPNYFLAIKKIKNSFYNDNNYLDELGIGVITLNKSLLRDIILPSDFENSRFFIVDTFRNTVLMSSLRNFYENEEITVDEIMEGKGNHITKNSKIGQTNMELVASVPITESERYYNLVILLLVVASAVLIILSILFSSFINYRLTKPIDLLINSINNVGKRNLYYKIEAEFDNELSDVKEAFNRMIDEIRGYTKRIISTQERLYETELLKNKYELSSLQSQINSHFLSNTLNCMRGMVMMDSKENLLEMIKNLVFFLRYIAEGSEYATIDSELTHADTYLKLQRLQRLQYGGGINIKYDVSENVGQYKILKLLMQPLLENAVFHGLKNRNKGTILIKVYEKEKFLYIKIYDTGTGMSPEVLERLRTALSDVDLLNKSTSIALINILKRIKLHYGDEADMYISSMKNIGSIVTLMIPNQHLNHK